MSRVQETIVKEDMIAGRKGMTKETRHFTGGKSFLELPFTVSFMETGNYEVHIDGGKVTVEKIG